MPYVLPALNVTCQQKVKTESYQDSKIQIQTCTNIFIFGAFTHINLKLQVFPYQLLILNQHDAVTNHYQCNCFAKHTII